MRVENVRVNDLKESMIASGYPMRTKTEIEESMLTEKVVERCQRLSKACDSGNGAHGQYLTGITVSFDLTFSNKAWVEMERYKFINFVSSQSTMHRITKFDLDKSYNSFVNPQVIDLMKKLCKEYQDLEFKIAATDNKEVVKDLVEKKKAKYLEILYTNPAGFELTARITTNYRCLRNIWIQRRDHRLPEWREFCKWIETLPFAKQLICYTDSEVGITKEEMEKEINAYHFNM